MEFLIITFVLAVVVAFLLKRPRTATSPRSSDHDPLAQLTSDEHDGTWVDGRVTEVLRKNARYLGHGIAKVSIEVDGGSEQFDTVMLPATYDDSFAVGAAATVRVEASCLDAFYLTAWDGKTERMMSSICAPLGLSGVEKTPYGWKSDGAIRERAVSVRLSTDGWFEVELGHTAGDLDLDFRLADETSPKSESERALKANLVVEVGDEQTSSHALDRLDDVFDRLIAYLEVLEGWVTFYGESVEFSGKIVVLEPTVARDVLEECVAMIAEIEKAVGANEELPDEWW